MRLSVTRILHNLSFHCAAALRCVKKWDQIYPKKSRGYAFVQREQSPHLEGQVARALDGPNDERYDTQHRQLSVHRL